jgi:sugar lactone lactonase YvrE
MRKLLLITLSVVISATTYAQNISTIAGGLGDGIPAINTPLSIPYSTAVDGLGNIYIADMGNCRIRKVTASTGIISTIAGNGILGYGGDGGAATSANLYYPSGVAVDGSGNIYIADAGNNRIRKVSASTGIISTIAGNGTSGFGGDDSLATSANLNSPSGVALDASRNIYIADGSNNRIRKVTASSGIISTVAGNGIDGYGGDDSAATSAKLNYPCGVAVDASGNIYIADRSNNRIRKVSASTGIISTVAGNGTQGFGGDDSVAVSAKLNYPYGVAVDGSGNIYIADVFNRRIRKVSAFSGIISTVAGNGTEAYGGDGSAATSANLSIPSGVSVDGSGNIYIADSYNNRIRKVSASAGIISTVAGNGRTSFGGDGNVATSAILSAPGGVAVDGLGNIYIVDTYNYRIRKVSASTGIISTVAGNGTYGYGGDDSAATSAKLNSPSGVAVDGSGNIYIADYFNHRIRRVAASTGIISTVAGNGTEGYGGDGSAATSAKLKGPSGVAVDGIGNIYIADTYNSRIRKITVSTGIISTVAGNGTAAYGGDGSAATSAKLNSPSGVAVDGSGNIYIADAGNNRIRKVSASTGIISTIAGNGTEGYGGDDSAATSAKLNSPSGVAVDGFGNIYIADYSNHRIRKVSAPNGIISTVAGNGTFGYEGDGGLATSANLSFPIGIAIEGFGNIYIANRERGRIQKVSYSIFNNITTSFQTICAGSAPNSLIGSTPIGGTGAYTYSWLSSTIGPTTGFTAIPSSNTINYSPGVLTQNTWFRRYVVSGASTDTSEAVAITLNTGIATNAITGTAQTICLGSIPAPITATMATGGNGKTYNYKWLKSTTSATTGFTNAGGNDFTQNYNSGALTQNTWFRRKVISGVCNADTTTAIAVTVNPKPLTSNIVGRVNVNNLDTASYSVNGMSGSVFNWIVSGATIQSGNGSSQIRVKWSSKGTQLLRVTETSNQGCIGAEKTLLVNVLPGVGINELKARNQVIIYPNPFSETIHITLLNNLKLERAIIYDLLGNEIISSNKNEIETSSLKPGVYLIMIVDNIGNSYNQKLIKN